VVEFPAGKIGGSTANRHARAALKIAEGG
jgi:hypothetical protein